MMSLLMPSISSIVRERPNMKLSISVSHVRKRGQARVQLVQPFSPWMQLSGPELLFEVERLVHAVQVVVAEDVVRAGDHTA